MDEKIFYVYLHAKPDGQVFYVGKGCGRRAYSANQRNQRWKKVAADGYVVSIVASGISEVQAYELETALIAYLYRFGNLVNIRAGGGPLGQHYLFKGRKISAEHRKKLAEVNRKYKREKYEKSSLTLSVGTWITPSGNFHSLRIAAESNGCSIMSVRNRCLGYIAKKGDKKYPVGPKEGWSFVPKNGNM